VLRFPVIVLFFAGLFCCSFLDCCDFLFWDAWDECFGLLIRPGFMYCTCWIPADIEYRITFLCHLECSCILLHGMPSTHCSTLPHGMCYPTQCFRVSKTLHLLQHLIISTAICICGGLNFLPERIWISCWRIEYLHWQASLWKQRFLSTGTFMTSGVKFLMSNTVFVSVWCLQVCSWGGYTFIINLIPIHVLLCIVTGRYSSRLYIAYAPLVHLHETHTFQFLQFVRRIWHAIKFTNSRVYCMCRILSHNIEGDFDHELVFGSWVWEQVILGTLLAALVPVVGFNAVMTSEHFASFLVWLNHIYMQGLVFSCNFQVSSRSSM